MRVNILSLLRLIYYAKKKVLFLGGFWRRENSLKGQKESLKRKLLIYWVLKFDLVDAHLRQKQNKFSLSFKVLFWHFATQTKRDEEFKSENYFKIWQKYKNSTSGDDRQHVCDCGNLAGTFSVVAEQILINFLFSQKRSSRK